MTRLTDRRTILLAAGTAAAAAVAGTVGAKSATHEISGIVEYEGGAAIPKGQVEISLKDAAADNARSAPTETSLESDGGSKTLTFSLPMPAGNAVSPTAQITARLKRVDGWLLARGSAEISEDGAVSVMLYTVMY